MSQHSEVARKRTPSVGTLVSGVVMLVLLLWVGGMTGGVGSVELAVWLGLLVGWVVWWVVQRRRS